MESALMPRDRVPDIGAREPWLGANLSLCFPGLGTWYAGTRIAGGLEFVAGAALLVTGAAFIFAPGLSATVGMILWVGFIPLWVFSIWNAHRACRDRATRGFDELRRSQRDAWKAVFLSRLIPGLGQLYDRRLAIGLVFAAASLGLALGKDLIWSLPMGIIAGGVCADAWWRARGRRGASARAAGGIATVVAVTFLASPLLTAWLKDHVVQAFSLSSASMSPILQRGDLVFVDRRARGSARIGEIVLLPFPDQPDRMFLKTVFAVEGDEVEFRRDGAWRDGLQVIARPTPNLALSSVLFGREGNPFRVPERAIFVLGDNYLDSNDSRFFGPILLDQVQGRAYKIYWPPGRARAL